MVKILYFKNDLFFSFKVLKRNPSVVGSMLSSSSFCVLWFPFWGCETDTLTRGALGAVRF